MIENTSLKHYTMYKKVIHAIKHTDKYKQLKLYTKRYNDKRYYQLAYDFFNHKYFFIIDTNSLKIEYQFLKANAENLIKIFFEEDFKPFDHCSYLEYDIILFNTLNGLIKRSEERDYEHIYVRLINHGEVKPLKKPEESYSHVEVRFAHLLKKFAMNYLQNKFNEVIKTIK